MVASVVMAVLAKDVDPLGKQIFMAAAVRGMADETIFLGRRMDPDKGATFVNMAGVTEQVRGFCLDHCAGQRSVRIVAIAAFYFTFEDRVAGLFAHLGLCFPMAGKTDAQLVYGGAPGMNGVAGGALHIIGRVLPHRPIDEIAGFGMAL